MLASGIILLSGCSVRNVNPESGALMRTTVYGDESNGVKIRIKKIDSFNDDEILLLCQIKSTHDYLINPYNFGNQLTFFDSSHSEIRPKVDAIIDPTEDKLVKYEMICCDKYAIIQLEVRDGDLWYNFRSYKIPPDGILLLKYALQGGYYGREPEPKELWRGTAYSNVATINFRKH